MTATTEDWADSMVAAAEPPTVEVKLFGKWNPDEIHVNDISLAVSWENPNIHWHNCAFIYRVFILDRTTYS